MDSKLNILMLDEDPARLTGIEERLDRLGYRFRSNASPLMPIEQMEALSPDLAILGPGVGLDAGIRCLHKLKIIELEMPVLIICENEASSDLMNLFPFDGIHLVPPDADEDALREIIGGALAYRQECRARTDFPVIIGQSAGLRDIRKKVRMVSAKDITVLVTGESGTGKELVARAIHYHSPRCKGPLVKINCGALPDELLESEVFGFQKGAFTGAHKNKPGRLEMADEGTLFIDEIGDLSLSLQVKFLQVLEDKSFSRLGGTRDTWVDTRVVAATHADLGRKVREGLFRRDLYYRLHVVHIEVPPLRRRKEDIPLLVHYFMNKYCFEYRKENLDVPEGVMGLLQAYDWPGNVRELENVIRRAIVIRDWNAIFKEMELGERIAGQPAGSFSGAKTPLLIWGDEKINKFFREKDFSLRMISKAYVSEVEKTAILKTLKETNWNRKRAAELLQVSYKTLLNRILEFDLKP